MEQPKCVTASSRFLETVLANASTSVSGRNRDRVDFARTQRLQPRLHSRPCRSRDSENARACYISIDPLLPTPAPDIDV